MPSQIRVDSITDLNGNGPTELPYGATLPTGSSFDIQGNINVSGISTVGVISASSAVVSGIVTASSFVGDGSGLTGVKTVNAGKSIALAIIGS